MATNDIDEKQMIALNETDHFNQRISKIENELCQLNTHDKIIEQIINREQLYLNQLYLNRLNGNKESLPKVQVAFELSDSK